MKKTVVLLAVCVLLAGVDMRPQQPTQASSAAPAAIEVKYVRMYSHDKGDRYDNPDYRCIYFDKKKSDRKSLKVSVDLSDDPGPDVKMKLHLHYTHSGESPRDEDLGPVSCKRDANPKTCRAEFEEPKRWHLSDQPDGTYTADGTLTGTVGPLKNTPLTFNYTFQNPYKCPKP